jgi:hypothetical protein
MRTNSGINGSHERFKGLAAWVHESWAVEYFPDHHA